MCPVNCDYGLSCGTDYEHGSQALFLHAESDRIAIHRDHVVDVLRGVRQCPLPQTCEIDWHYPGAMIAFVNCPTERNTGSLKSTHVVAEIHEQGGIMRQFLQIGRQFRFKGNAGSGVRPGLAEAHRLRPPDRNIACSNEGCSSAYNCSLRDLVSREVQHEIRCHRGCHGEGGKKLQTITYVVKSKWPPHWKVNRDTAIRYREHVKRKQGPQQ